MTLFLVVSMLCMIVAPKVKRATSGEKIVMSKLLDPNLSRRHSSIALRRATSMNGVVANEDRGPMSPEGAISASEQTAIANASARFRANAIVLNIDDPPPRRIERQMFFLKDLISEFTNNRYVYCAKSIAAGSQVRLSRCTFIEVSKDDT